VDPDLTAPMAVRRSEGSDPRWPARRRQRVQVDL